MNKHEARAECHPLNLFYDAGIRRETAAGDNASSYFITGMTASHQSSASFDNEKYDGDDPLLKKPLHILKAKPWNIVSLQLLCKKKCPPSVKYSFAWSFTATKNKEFHFSQTLSRVIIAYYVVG